MRFKNYLMVLSTLFAINCNCNFNKNNILNQPKKDTTCTPTSIKISDYKFSACEEDLDSRVKKAMILIADLKDHGKKYGLDNEYYLKYVPDHRLKGYALYELWVTPKLFLPENFQYTFKRINQDGNHAKKFDNKIIRYQSRIDNLLDEKKDYKKMNYDVYHREIFNFAGSRNAKINDSLINYSYNFFIETVFHESWHAKVYSKKRRFREISIEEGMATIMGYLLAKDFFRYRDDEVNLKRMKNRKKIAVEEGKRIKKLYDSLVDLYNNEDCVDKKNRLRKEIYGSKRFRPNNARLFSRVGYRYYLPLFNQVYEKVGCLEEFIKLMHKTPYDRENAVKYLESIIKEEK